MDVKVVFVIVCLCVLAITSTEAGIPNCCMRVRTRFKPGILKKVQRMEMQEINGSCEIEALVLYVNGLEKPLCAHPSLKPKLKPVWRVMRKKKRSS